MHLVFQMKFRIILEYCLLPPPPPPFFLYWAVCLDLHYSPVSFWVIRWFLCIHFSVKYLCEMNKIFGSLKNCYTRWSWSLRHVCTAESCHDFCETGLWTSSDSVICWISKYISNEELWENIIKWTPVLCAWRENGVELDANAP